MNYWLYALLGAGVAWVVVWLLTEFALSKWRERQREDTARFDRALARCSRRLELQREALGLPRRKDER